MMNRNRIKALLLFAVFISGAALAAAAAETGGIQDHRHHMPGHTHAARPDEVKAGISTEPKDVVAGRPAVILVSLMEPDGKPMENLSIHHDRLVHVVIASRDFSVFAHIHPEDFGPVTPEMKKAARYPVRFTFPKGGQYIIGIDFAAGDRTFSRRFLVDVSGEPRTGPPRKDLSKEKSFGDLDVSLSYVPEHIAAGKEATLTYMFRTKNGPATDLEPYLSAPMHLAIISADLTRFIHTHGELPAMMSMGHDSHNHTMEMQMQVPEKFGPKIEAHAVFPAKGLYMIFGQVGHKGKVIDTGFMVEVE